MRNFIAMIIVIFISSIAIGCQYNNYKNNELTSATKSTFEINQNPTEKGNFASSTMKEIISTEIRYTVTPIIQATPTLVETIKPPLDIEENRMIIDKELSSINPGGRIILI